MDLDTLRAQTQEGCWLWKGRVNGGYAVLCIAGVDIRVHRLAWELANGREIPRGAVVRHSCDESRCINPEHLCLGTHEENAKDHRDRASWAIQSIPSETAQALIAEYTPGMRGKGMKALAAKYGIDRNTVRKYLRRALSHTE